MRTSQVGMGELECVTEGKCGVGRKGVLTEIMMRESEGEEVVHT